jgi:predicted TIM-barrel fold metal-dependent hydrolase
MHARYAEARGSPPAPTDKLGSAEVLLEGMREANVQGFMIVQPIFHGFDHSYVTHCIEKYPAPFKAMLLIDPTLSVEAAVAEVRRLHAAGYIGVRINSGQWSNKGTQIDDEVGRAVFAVCGELGMTAGILCGGFADQAATIESLAADFPGTDIVIDHFAGVLPGADGWPALVALSKYSNVYVKVSGWCENPQSVQSVRQTAPARLSRTCMLQPAVGSS